MLKLCVRPMEKQDIEESIPVARYMHSCSPVYKGVPFVDSAMRTGFLRAIEQPDCWFCRVVEYGDEIVGGMLGYAASEIFSDRRTAADLGIFVKEKFRGSRAAFLLVRAFEAWARSVGCLKIAVGVSAGTNNAKAERLYAGTGFVEVGKIFHKELM